MYGTAIDMYDGLLGPERTLLFINGICPPPGAEIYDRSWDLATWLLFQLAMQQMAAARRQ